MERLATQPDGSRRPTRWRSRAAEVLYRLAVRLDACVVPAGPIGVSASLVEWQDGHYAVR